MKKEIILLVFATLYLIIYTMLGQLGGSMNIIFAMFFLSPFLMIWVVLSILKAKNINYEGLKDGEEWGYKDVNKEDLGIF